MYLYDSIAYKWLRTIKIKARKSAFITLLRRAIFSGVLVKLLNFVEVNFTDYTKKGNKYKVFFKRRPIFKLR